jgi:hypothetical protein
MASDRASKELVDERSSAVEARGIPIPPRLGPTAAIVDAEPPWFFSPFTPIEWEAFARYPNYLLAQIVAGLLENEGLPAIIVSWTAFPGALSADVWVPQHLMHRAQWIVALAPPTDAELHFLATGELSSGEEQG